MVIINFETFPKVTVPDGLAPSLKQDWKSSIRWLKSIRLRASSH